MVWHWGDPKAGLSQTEESEWPHWELLEGKQRSQVTCKMGLGGCCGERSQKECGNSGRMGGRSPTGEEGYVCVWERVEQEGDFLRMLGSAVGPVPVSLRLVSGFILSRTIPFPLCSSFPHPEEHAKFLLYQACSSFPVGTTRGGCSSLDCHYGALNVCSI